MQSPRPRRPTAPLVISVLALVAALGGVAYSAIPDASGRDPRLLHQLGLTCGSSTAPPAATPAETALN